MYTHKPNNHNLDASARSRPCRADSAAPGSRSVGTPPAAAAPRG